MDTAPIVLFVYNRPWHTRQTVEALRRTELAEQSELHIFSDAPKSPTDREAVGAVREYIRTIDGFRSLGVQNRCPAVQPVIGGGRAELKPISAP